MADESDIVVLEMTPLSSDEGYSLRCVHYPADGIVSFQVVSEEKTGSVPVSTLLWEELKAILPEALKKYGLTILCGENERDTFVVSASRGELRWIMQCMKLYADKHNPPSQETSNA